MKVGFPVSLSILFWSIIGLARLFEEKTQKKKPRIPSRVILAERKKVAVCLPAHNEEAVILKSIKAIKRQVPVKQIYVVSDGSTDKTAAIARAAGCTVMVNKKGKGKAKALKGLMQKYRLLTRFEYILIVDADTKLDKNYMKRALAFMLSNPKTAALAAHAIPQWHKKFRINDADFISAYRIRLYKILQLTFMYGQTWKHANVNMVVPGFAALYRTKIFRRLTIDTPGIWIEDFNLAFQIHKKKLGTIGYHPSIFAEYEDPIALGDYWNQVKRWNVGLFQTIRVHGVWPSFFWLSLIVFHLEIISLVFFITFLPFMFLYVLVLYFGLVPPSPAEIYLSDLRIYYIETLIGLTVIDYLITVGVALHERKYRLLIYGPFFLFFQFIHSLIFLSALRKGFFGKSEGKWIPARRV